MSAGFLLADLDRPSTERLCEEFPAYGSVLLRLANLAFFNLRTVIVTAAVYRGFDSELRLMTNPSS